MAESIIKLAWIQFWHLHLGVVLVPWSLLFSKFLCLVSHSLAVSCFRKPCLSSWSWQIQATQHSLQHYLQQLEHERNLSKWPLTEEWTARRSNPVYPKGNQSWIFIRRADVEAETPILWPPDMKSWLIWKDPDAGKDWGEEKTEDEVVGWHHQLDGHELE